MFEKMIEVMVRIAVVLERIAGKIDDKQVGMAAPAAVGVAPQVQSFSPATTGVDPAVGVNPIVDPAAAGQVPVGQGSWDPTCAEKQGSYRTKDKQEAIMACLTRLNIQAPKSWSWAKKHQAILDHVAQFGAVAGMTWADFETNIKAFVASNQRDDILAVVLELEGHQVVGEANIQPANYQVILDRVAALTAQPIAGADAVGAAADPSIVTRQVDPATLAVLENPATPAEQAVDYTPGAPVSTLDQLRAYCRYLTENGLAPAAVQAALAPIAAGVTYVTVEQIPQAVQLLNNASNPAPLV